MAKLSDIGKGTRAIKRIALPLVNRPNFINPDVPELALQRESDTADALMSGEPATPDQVMVGLRILTLNELTKVYEKAGDFARERGVKEPNEADPIYNLGTSIYICAMACVDPDSDAKDPEPFFGTRGDLESAARELLDSVHIGRDGIAYLAEAHESWQDICNPRANRIAPNVFYDTVVALADNNPDKALATFLALRPGMLLAFMRTTARLLLTLLPEKSSYGAISVATQSNGSKNQG